MPINTYKRCRAQLKPMGLAKPMNIKIGGGATGTVGSKPAAVVKKSGALNCWSNLHSCTKIQSYMSWLIPALSVIVFANDSESEEEEMPAEARMRMRNVGKDTPTSAGPNSFNKTTRGFSVCRPRAENSFILVENESVPMRAPWYRGLRFSNASLGHLRRIPAGHGKRRPWSWRPKKEWS